MEIASMALNINPGDPIFIGDIFGFIIAIAISLFLAYWLSAVKNHLAVIVGAFIGALIGFIFILAWAGTLINSTPLEGANAVTVFFGSALFCSVLGLVGGIATDVLLARRNSAHYRRQTTHE